MLKTVLLLSFLATTALCADRPIPGHSTPRMPPPGIAVPAETRAGLEQGVADLGWAIADLQTALKARPEMLELLPDVEIYHNAVRYALEDGLFYKTNDFAAARKLLDEGRERAHLLKQGLTPWTTNSGLVVRGYRSKIDGSVQPYGLVVPPTYRPGTNHQHRLDVWLHGRNNYLSELAFITEREKSRGDFTPDDAFVLHPYGRYCNAFKFAGEADVFEALANVREHYPIDTNRLAIRGFSMGGAGTWHLAAHYAGTWAAASPGAGFVDTAIYQKMVEQTNSVHLYDIWLWHLYDVPDYAANLFNCPVVAYSGEIDPQKQAADLMGVAMAAEGVELTHIIGPGTAHKYEPKAKAEVARRVDALVAKGHDPVPKKVRFTTWTLRYNQMDWITVEGLEQHWSRARVDAEIASSDFVSVVTENVSALTLTMPAGSCPLALTHPPKVALDGQVLTGPAVGVDRAWTARFAKTDGRWALVEQFDDSALRKRHGLQGPVDDAFMDSFIMVRPTGSPMNPRVGAWAAGEMAQAVADWRWQFRGEPRVKNDTEITDADMAASNLVLWGDPRSNRVLGRIASRLPIRWTERGVRFLDRDYSADDHVPVMIFPNPLNPKHYVVINSGFTFSEAAPTSNALQIPKLPDYAVFDLQTKRVVAAGFFDEQWKLSALR